MSEEITLDKEVFKALAGETRVAVLKALLERRKTQSELAKELGLAAPTIKDHVDILHKAGLVVEVNDGHKWKYIQLTVKGKSLLQPQDKRILVLLGTSLVGIAASAFLAYNQFTSALPPEMAPVPEGFSTLAVSKTMGAIASGAGNAAAGTAPAADAMVQTAAPSALSAVQLLSVLPLFDLTVLVICLVVFGVSVGMWIKHAY